MKRTAWLFILTFSISIAYSQTINLEKSVYDKMIEEKGNSERLIGKLRDSIGKIHQNHAIETDVLNDSLQKVNAELDDKTDQLTKAKDGLKDLQKQFDKNKIKNERDSLNRQVAVLNVTITNLRNEITILKTSCQREAENRYKAGRREIQMRISDRYDAEFDSLVNECTLAGVQHDMLLVTDASTKKKMQDLLTYFRAEQVLSEKYDAQKVQFALNNLTKIMPATQAVKILKEKLGYYKNCTSALKSMMGEIIEIDKNFSAPNEPGRDKKRKRIMPVITSFIYNQEFEFDDYPYLGNIVLEIINRKQRDVDKSIYDLLKKL